MNAITYEMLESFSKEFHAQEKNEVAMRAVMKSGLSAAAENMPEQLELPQQIAKLTCNIIIVIRGALYENNRQQRSGRL